MNDEQEPAMFTTEWRTLQVENGISALNKADDLNFLSDRNMEMKMYWVAVAQAYFQAANIRSRPRESAPKDRTTFRDLKDDHTYADRFGNLWKNGEIIKAGSP